MKYLLDTNVLSEPLKRQPHQNVMKRLEKYQKDIVTAAIVIHELYYGWSKLPEGSKKKKTIKTYLDNVIIPSIPSYPYDNSAAKCHAIERARQKAIGRPMPFVDGQIAAIAAVNNFTLVTRNLTDFKSYSDLKIVNWHSSKDGY